MRCPTPTMPRNAALASSVVASMPIVLPLTRLASASRCMGCWAGPPWLRRGTIPPPSSVCHEGDRLRPSGHRKTEADRLG